MKAINIDHVRFHTTRESFICARNATFMLKQFLVSVGLLMVVILSSVMIGEVTYAQIDNTDNPLVSDTDAGGVEQVAVPGAVDGTNTKDSLVNVIKGVVNRVLGILGLIALIVLLWGGFQMVTAAGDDDKYKAGFKILKQAAIGLVLIGVAWFVISLVFWLINITTQQAGGSAGTDG